MLMAIPAVALLVYALIANTTPTGKKPKPLPAPAKKRTPLQAALDLLTYLESTENYGSASSHPQEIRDAQRDLGVTADGLVGPKTRAAAQEQGVTLPYKLSHDDPSLDALASDPLIADDVPISPVRPPAEPSKPRVSYLKPKPDDYAHAKIELTPATKRQQEALLKDGRAIVELDPEGGALDDAAAREAAPDGAASDEPKLGRDPFQPPAGEPTPVATIETIPSSDADDSEPPAKPSKPELSKAKAPDAPGRTGKRSPRQAAEDLRDYLERTHNFGSATSHPQEIRDAQRDMGGGLKADGIAGPKTRAAAQAQGVTLPPRTAALPAQKQAAKPAAKPAAARPAAKTMPASQAMPRPRTAPAPKTAKRPAPKKPTKKRRK